MAQTLAFWSANTGADISPIDVAETLFPARTEPWIPFFAQRDASRPAVTAPAMAPEIPVETEASSPAVMAFITPVLPKTVAVPVTAVTASRTEPQAVTLAESEARTIPAMSPRAHTSASPPLASTLPITVPDAETVAPRPAVTALQISPPMAMTVAEPALVVTVASTLSPERTKT